MACRQPGRFPRRAKDRTPTVGVRRPAIGGGGGGGCVRCVPCGVPSRSRALSTARKVPGPGGGGEDAGGGRGAGGVPDERSRVPSSTRTFSTPGEGLDTYG